MINLKEHFIVLALIDYIYIKSELQTISSFQNVLFSPFPLILLLISIFVSCMFLDLVFLDHFNTVI